MIEREKFEAWTLTRTEYGAEFVFAVWQASRAAALEEAAKECDRLSMHRGEMGQHEASEEAEAGGMKDLPFPLPRDIAAHRQFLVQRRDHLTDDYGNQHLICQHEPRIFGTWYYWMSGEDEREARSVNLYPEFH